MDEQDQHRTGADSATPQPPLFPSFPSSRQLLTASAGTPVAALPDARPSQVWHQHLPLSGFALAVAFVMGLVWLVNERAMVAEVVGPVVQTAPVTPPTAPDPAPEVPEVVERAVPLHVRIGSITVDAPLVPVGIEDDGAMEIPEDVREIGWYDPDGELGVVPGAVGTAVLAGHVDSRSQGRGALYDLRALRAGDTIELDLSDGTTQSWVVTDVIQYPKDVLPYDELFVWSGPERLAIITCGGEFDRTARSYTDNIVVYAVPSASAPAVPSASAPAANPAA